MLEEIKKLIFISIVITVILEKNKSSIERHQISVKRKHKEIRPDFF